MNLLTRYPVPLAVGLLVLFFGSYADLTVPFVAAEMTGRLARNLLLTLSLIVPVVAGLGLNFGIVLGAMAGQAALILVRTWHIGGLPGLVLAALLATPLAIVLGVAVGRLLNRAKGREMITGIIASFFANGVYKMIFLFFFGSALPLAAWTGKHPMLAGVVVVGLAALLATAARGTSSTAMEDDETGPSTSGRIPPWLGPTWKALTAITLLILAWGLLRVRDPELILPQGYGLVVSVSLDWAARLPAVTTPGTLAYALDGLVQPHMTLNSPGAAPVEWMVPLGTFIVVALVCVALRFLLATKLGQEMRALGQEMHVAGVLGIQVDRVRITAIVVSTVLAAWGQLVFLQNMGTLNVYSNHEQVGMLAVAALLIGGASVTEATIGHALLGTLLLHLLLLVSAKAGPNLFPGSPSGAAQIGEYIRSSAAYGVIALALALHAIKGRGKPAGH